MNPGVTSLDVARLARVSQSAVSRAFTPGRSVSAETRRRIMEAARALGYRPNAHARSLITGRSRIIGLVLSYLENLFYPVALEALARRLQRDGHHVLLFVNQHPNADDLVDEILQYHVDGIVLAASTLSSGLAQQCADAGIPVVLFNRVMAAGAAGAVSSVRSDNEGGGRALARFLAAAGHRRIAFIAGNEESSTNLERERGFRDGLAAAGLRIWARGVGNYDFDTARRAALEMFARPADRPDAVFVASDHMAFAVMDALRLELGLSIPDQVSVVGFDNVPQAAWGSYRLTTYEQPVAPMIEATVGLLERYLAGAGVPAAENVVVPGALVVRDSARQAPAGAAPARAPGRRRPPARGGRA
ncbi:MAG: LacI family DNA-binding transcriptional regulator [Burkholderiales bacterium]|nr:LacI family DNA-binding transcriptional regulator [Burkholderiales bacterium]